MPSFLKGELRYTENDEGLVYYTPEGSFEVDGIIYTPPWLEEGPESTVHYQPMLEFKQQHYCPPELFEDL